MITVNAPATSRPRTSLPRVATLAASVLLLAAAALAVVLWNRMPDFPPPAANETLLLMRRVCLVGLALVGVLTLPWAARPAMLPMVGIALHVFGIVIAIFTVVSLRGDALAGVFWVPVVGSAAACLAIIWSSFRGDSSPAHPARGSTSRPGR